MPCSVPNPLPRSPAGLINTSGDIWRNQRRFLHERLRGLGIKLGGAGRMRMEERIRVRPLYTQYARFAWYVLCKAQNRFVLR